MASKREEIIAALEEKLRKLLPCDVLRNETEPDTIPVQGLFLMEDGEPPGEPIEIVLSPPVYFWQHAIPIMAIAHGATQAVRTSIVDGILMSVQQAIDEDVRLGGLADYVETRPSMNDHENMEGAEAVVRARATVLLHYNSASALG